jgi:hypothetical protein
MAVIPPNWNAILNKQGLFSDQEIACAAHWPTCVIGEGAHRFPETVAVNPGDWYAPLDPKLYMLGRWFSDAVEAHDRREARRLYARVQHRIRVLRETP